MKILLTTAGKWHLDQTAKAFETRGALAGLWTSDRPKSGVSQELCRRCMPFQWAMQPWYRWASQIVVEKMFYKHLPLWRAWMARQPLPDFDVMQSMMGFATEGFDLADRTGALKVLDCQNGHPTSYRGFWQREMDLWGKGHVPIPDFMFARMNREIARADLILCPSQYVYDSMLYNGVSVDKCVITPFGVNTSVFKKREALPEHPRFICVGTICLRKGHQYLFRAFEKVREQLPDAELIVVGSYKNDFDKERPKWEGKFTHIPSLPHAELSELLRNCTAFVMPSCEEGFARVLIEAMACGLPIIASHESGASTFVKDGEQGYIVAPQNRERLADCMIKLGRNPELAMQMGDQSFATGGEGNSWQDYGDRLLEIYRGRVT
jgi:glycosyltransferase involved in cell wall biosynthesis